MRFTAIALLFTAVSASGIHQAIDQMTEEELDLMALQLKNAAAAKKAGAKPKDCSDEMMNVYDKFIAHHEANDKMVHDAIVRKGKAYPGELNKFETDANKFLDAAHSHVKTDLSDANLAKTRKDQDEFFSHVKHGLKVGLKQERENSAAFFKGYGVAYDAGLKVWQQKKGAFRATVNKLADSVETLSEKHAALVKSIETLPEMKAEANAWLDFGDKFNALMKESEELDRAQWEAAGNAVDKEFKMEKLEDELEDDLENLGDEMNLRGRARFGGSRRYSLAEDDDEMELRGRARFGGSRRYSLAEDDDEMELRRRATFGGSRRYSLAEDDDEMELRGRARFAASRRYSLAEDDDELELRRRNTFSRRR